MAIRKTKSAGATTSAERTHDSKRPSWGDNGKARMPTQQYKDNWDAIFGKKNEKSC